jgi:hypothetical protein
MNYGSAGQTSRAQPVSMVNECAPTEQRLTVRAIEDQAQIHAFVQHLLVRVTETADRHLGPAPTAQDKNGIDGAPSGEIFMLLGLQGMTRTALSRIEEQLDRLNRL